MSQHQSFRRKFALVAALCVLAPIIAPSQQSNKSKATNSSNGQNQGAEVRTEKIKFKQDLGTQAAATRGVQTTTANPSGKNSGNSGSNGSSSQIKQDFGPQAVAGRKDRMTVATQQGQGNSGSGPNGSATSATTNRQDFGPSVHGSRKDLSTVARPTGQKSNQTQTTASQNSAGSCSGPTQNAQPASSNGTKPQ